MAHHHHHHDHANDHDHAHGQSHSHDHGHVGHSHAPDHFGFAFAFGATLNTLFVAAELAFGYKANSLALISDAVHNFSDVISLLLAWGAVCGLRASGRPSSTPMAIGGLRSWQRSSMPAFC